MKKASIKLKLYGILALICFMILITTINVFRLVEQNKKYDTVVLNLLERQRMLSQAMAKSVLVYSMAKSEFFSKDAIEGRALLNPSLEEYEQIKTIFSQTLVAMKSGGKAALDLKNQKFITIKPVEDVLVQKKIREVETLFERFTSQVNLLKKGVVGTNSYREATQNMVMHSNQLKDASNELAKMSKDHINENLRTIQKTLVISGAFVLLVIGCLAWMFTISVIRPLKTLCETVINVEQTGDFSLQALGAGHDEVGVTIEAFNRLMTSLHKEIPEVNEVMHAMLQGVFTKRVLSDSKGELKRLKEGVNGSVENMETIISVLNRIMSGLANGNFQDRMTDLVKGDLDMLKDNINCSMDTLESTINSINQVMSEIASGNLGTRIEIDAKGALNTLKVNTNDSVDSLQTTMKSILDHSRQVAHAVTETSKAVMQVSNGSSKQVAAISEVADAIHQTSIGIDEVTENAENANHVAQDTTKIVKLGKEKMDQMVEVVNTISRNSSQVYSIIDVIGKIANQTNLLSLNAAIEAERAGTHGKGFGVVAEEIRRLAESSGNSVDEIATLIKQAVQRTEKGVVTAQDVNREMDKIVDAAKQSRMMLQSISNAVESQNRTMHTIDDNVDTLRVIGENNATAAEEIIATVTELSKLAERTREKVERFRW